MSLEKLMDKYDPMKTKETAKPEPEAAEFHSWKDSAPVIRLSDMF